MVARVCLFAVLMSIGTAAAAPTLATNGAEPEIKAVKPKAPVPGRIIYVNDDDWQWKQSSLIAPDLRDLPEGSAGQHRKDGRHGILLLNGAADRGTSTAIDTTTLVPELIAVLKAGGEVVMLDDGELYAPVLIELLAHWYGRPDCLELSAQAVQWVNGRTRYLIPNRGLERLATCTGASVQRIRRDAGDMPGRVFVIGKSTSSANAQVAR